MTYINHVKSLYKVYISDDIIYQIHIKYIENHIMIDDTTYHYLTS